MQGRYLPVFASEIYDQNQLAEKDGRSTLNLKSVIIGNGLTDVSTRVCSPAIESYILTAPYSLYAGRFEIECWTAALDVPFQTISTCVRMKSVVRRFVSLRRSVCSNAASSRDAKRR